MLTRAAAEAFSQAVEAGGAKPGQVPSVFTSAWGEISTTLEMLEQMATETEGLPSPTRFHNSVHNTSAGSVSIATANRSFSTSIAAGPRSVAMGLLEAGALVSERGGEVVLVALDEPPPAPFAPRVPYPLLAVALLLSTTAGHNTRARISGLRRGACTSRAADPFAAHPCAGAVLLAEAVLGQASITVDLSLTGEADWLVDVEPLPGRA
jgi:hypothetical protein